MLSGHVSEEVIELLVAHTFLQPSPWRAPSSAMTGFLRTLLFISKWDWRTETLIVDFNGTMTSQDVSSINTRLEAWRKVDPAMNRTVVFVASSHDPTGTAFTDKGPSRMVAARMTALARSACKLVKDQALELHPKSLFVSSTTDYDFVIYLSSKFIPQLTKEANKQRFKNLEVQSELDLEKIGHSPVQVFLNELKRIYGSSVVLFHDSTAGAVIAGLWNPQLQTRAFGVNLILDKATMLAEIARIGGDMVSKIEINQSLRQNSP